MWLWMKRHCNLVNGWMVHTERAPKRQQFHVAPARQQTKSANQYTTSVGINNTRSKRIQSLIQNHVRSASAREQRIALYKSYE